MSDNVKLNPFNFTSEVYSLDRLMAGGVQNDLGLVIPDYQRGYTWEQEEVERLFIDILISLINRSSEPSGHFLGATVWNLRRRAEETDFSVPSYDIVDGQQRITTCLLLTINLLFSIRAGHAQVKADTTIPTELLNWLNAEISQVETQASQMLVGDIKFGDDYPRLIYEQDVRAKEHSHSEYNSPIAKLILSTFSSLNTGQLKPDFGAITVKKEDKNSLERMIDNFNFLSECLSKLHKVELYDEYNINFIEKSELKKKLFKELFEASPAATGDFDRLLNSHIDFEILIRKIQFFWQFFKATCFTVITCDKEDAAFTIFDSLNTTGVPLTAIETLKPYVMRDYRQATETFSGSISDSNFEYIENAIRAYGNDAAKQSTLSKEFSIHASLLGGKEKIINNNLSTQRSTLREMQQKCQENGEIDLASTVVERVVRFRHDLCAIDNIRMYTVSGLSHEQIEDIKLTCNFLASTQTRLYRPLLTRFAWNTKEVEFFHRACKAITAFYVLRRATTPTTDRIDDIWRNAMCGKSPFKGFELDYKTPLDLTEARFVEFKDYLKSELNSSNLTFTLSDKDKWVDHVTHMPLYRGGTKTLLRFMLFIAHDGAKIDGTDRTLIQRKDATPDSSTEFLKFSVVDKDLYETLEHVAPQNEKPGWPGVYDDPKTKDTIGNFVLLPKGLNSALQDSPWEVKRLFLKVLLRDDMSGRISLVSKAKANGILLPPSIEKNVLDPSAGSLTKSHMLSGLEYVTTWDGDYIRKRSERLCELVWDKIKEWLD